MVILSNTVIIADYTSKWYNGKKDKFDDLDSFEAKGSIKNLVLQAQWENVVGTADAELKVYSTLENIKTLEHTHVINTTSNVGDAEILDFTDVLMAGFSVELELHSVTSIDLLIHALID